MVEVGASALCKSMRGGNERAHSGTSLPVVEVLTIAAHQRVLPKAGWRLSRQLRSVLPPLRVHLRGDSVPSAALACRIHTFATVVDLELTGKFALATAGGDGPLLQLPPGLQCLRLDCFRGQLGPVPAGLQVLYFFIGDGYCGGHNRVHSFWHQEAAWSQASTSGAAAIIAAMPADLHELRTDLPDVEGVPGLTLPPGLCALTLAELIFRGSLAWDQSVTCSLSALPPTRNLERLELQKRGLPSQLVLPDTLQELIVTDCSPDPDVEPCRSTLQLPGGLRSLTVAGDRRFGGEVIDLGVLPPALTKLHLDNSKGRAPASGTLCFSPLPDAVEELHLKGRLPPIDALPMGLRKLVIATLGHPLPQLPPLLVELVAAQYEHALPPLPPSLRHLTVRQCAAPLPPLPEGLLSLRVSNSPQLEPQPLLVLPQPRCLRSLWLDGWDFGVDVALPETLEVLHLTTQRPWLAEGCCLPALPASLLQLTCWVHDSDTDSESDSESDADSAAPVLCIGALPPCLTELAVEGVRLSVSCVVTVPASVKELSTGRGFAHEGLVFESGRPPRSFRTGERRPPCALRSVLL